MYRLEFEDNEIGRRRFEVCTQALMLSSPQTGGRSAQVVEWDDIVALLKALKEVGVKTKQFVNGRQLYDLIEGGGTVFLEKSERSLLLEYLKQPMWVPEALEDVQAIIKWLTDLTYERGSRKQEDTPMTRKALGRPAKDGGVAGSIEPVKEEVPAGESLEDLEERIRQLKEKQAGTDA